MAKAGRKPKLDDTKKAQCTAPLAAGCSRTDMAAQVGISLTALRNTLARDPEFARAVVQAENQRQINHLRRLDLVSQRSWRASARMLELLHPKDFRRHPPGTRTKQQLKMPLARVAALFLDCITDRARREWAMTRYGLLARSLELPELKEHDVQAWMTPRGEAADERRTTRDK